MIKQIVSSLAVLLLSGCVYYVPYEVAATEPWVDEPVAYEEPGVVYESYVVSPYYPWASVDYFYLGNNYYRPASSISFSFGFYGGGAWYPPYYGPFYYAAWYQPFYGFPYPCPYPYAYGYSGAGYDYWNHRYPRHAYRASYDDDDGYHGGGHEGGNQDGRGGHGNGRYGRTAPMSNYGNGDDDSIRNNEHRSLDRHVQIQRQPGQFSRNVSSAPPAGGADHGMTVIGGGDNKIQPSRLQPVGNKGRNAGSSRAGPDAPVDLSGFAGQKGQAGAGHPGQNKIAPSRTGMPAGSSRSAPAVVEPSSRRFAARQAAVEPAQLPQPTPRTERARPEGNYSRQPNDAGERSETRSEDSDGSLHRRDRDNH